MIFDNFSEAKDYCDIALTTLPNNPGDVTSFWDIPNELTNGKWIVFAMPNEGIIWQSDWIIKENIDNE